jgi:hypothetical protein
VAFLLISGEAAAGMVMTGLLVDLGVRGVFAFAMMLLLKNKF